MVAGAAFTCGGLVILMGDVLMRPLEWSQYHLLTVLTVFGVIASGHLMATAASARSFIAALGFGVLFLSGTGLVVYQSVGRQAEVSDVRAADAEAVNEAIAAKSADLHKARARFADAERMVEKEMNGERCLSRCKDWKTRATEVRAHIQVLEGEIAALGPRKPVNAKAEKMAEVAALFGWDRGRAQAALTLLEPFLWTLFFEIGSIVSLGYAFRSGPRPANDNRPADTFRQTDFPKLTVAETESVSQFLAPESGQIIQFPARHPVISALEKAGGSVESNRQLAEIMGVTEGEASKRVDEVRDQLEIVRCGKWTRISLRRVA
jgi:hypothetical protein